MASCRRNSKEIRDASHPSLPPTIPTSNFGSGSSCRACNQSCGRWNDTIRAAIPDLAYAVKYKRAFYGVPELGWVIEIAPYDVSVNVLFLGGADFRPPPPLGDTGQTRYVKIAAEDEVREPNIADWIEQAGHTPGWK